MQALILALLLALSPVARAEQVADPVYEMRPIGWVRKHEGRTYIEVEPRYQPALLGVAELDSIWVLYWFDRNDTPEQRAILQVHPRRNPSNPLTGVFATRAPVRPNLIGLTCCRIVSIKNNILEVEGLDARKGTPILDLKPYLPGSDALPEAQVPWWVKKPREGDK